MSRRILFIVAVLASAVVSNHAQNFVANPGFETGDFTGWTLGGDTSYCFVSTIMPHGGTYSAFLGPVSSDGFLDQTISTVVGISYHVDFWLANAGFAPNDFSASFAGVTFYSVVNAPNFGYTDISGNITAASSSSDLHFEFFNPPACWFLDDISVNVVPEPPPWAMMAMGSVVLIGVQRLVRRKKA